MRRFFLLIPVTIILFTMCSQTTWVKTDNGVIIRLRSVSSDIPGQIRLEIADDDVIHVLASAEKGFSEEKSLCVIDQDRPAPDFRVKQVQDTLIISTARVIAKVSLVTGQVIFCDENGKVILSEKAGGGKSFAPVTVEGTSGYSVGQVFDSPADEAFYGLGQHQSDEFNYKGLNESLYQYNTKVSVPFIVSSRNYGLLWDNYSLTKFGDPRDYSQVDLFTLYDKDGGKGGLTATYYVNSDTSRIFAQRKESAIDYENLETIKGFPEKFQFYNSIITWTGEIEPQETGIYFFRLYYAGYTKLWVDGELVVPERWRTAWNPNTYKFNRNLEKGRKYSVRLEWKPDGGVSYIGLKVLSPRPVKEQESLSLTSEMGNAIDYWFIRGNNMDDVIGSYRMLTGKAPIMPRWALGYWQSRERYRSQDELLGVVKEYRKRNIPLDNIVLDWSYWPVDSWGSHEFDPKFFPDPSGMVESVHKLNAKIMISVWPKFYYTTDHYKEFDNRGWMYRQAVNDSVRDWIGKGYIGSFYDPYSQGARDLFWEQMREHLFTKGFDAWWMDASEPDILSNASIEYRKLLSTPTALGPSTKYFNTYALVNAMAIYEGQRSTEPNRRVFLLTRSGFAGLQKYSTATWSGDIGTRWEDMKAQIPAGLNFALSGIPYWTFDIGGFCVENRYTRAIKGSEDLNEWRELNTRWFQFGSFCPLFRSHGQYPYREIFNISPAGSPAYESMVYYDKLRYRLMPYLYSLAGVTYFNDYTIMRPMVMDFGSDKAVKNIGDQYMFGPSLLVAPVYKYKARTRNVYFPSSCGWYDFYSGIYILGGHQVKVDAPFEQIPLFVREGSIIPFGPEIQFTGEKPADPITLYVYTGRNCGFTLYEDEGTNYNYERGEWSTIKFSYNDSTGDLTIDGRNGEFGGMLKERTFRIVWVTRNNHVAFHPGIVPHETVRYNGEKIVVKRSVK
jgi:alpha-D-xyloside xylohydrolase